MKKIALNVIHRNFPIIAIAMILNQIPTITDSFYLIVTMVFLGAVTFAILNLIFSAVVEMEFDDMAQFRLFFSIFVTSFVIVVICILLYRMFPNIAIYGVSIFTISFVTALKTLIFTCLQWSEINKR